MFKPENLFTNYNIDLLLDDLRKISNILGNYTGEYKQHAYSFELYLENGNLLVESGEMFDFINGCLADEQKENIINRFKQK